VTARAPAGATGGTLGPPASSGQTVSFAKPVPADSSQTPPPRARLFLIVASVLAACWGLALALLAYFTANAVMLNREQILASPFVVTATVEGNPSNGRVSVEREWKKHALSGTITVKNLTAVGARPGIKYVMPLYRPDDAFRVTETPFSSGTPLIYPATPDALKQLEAIVGHADAGHP
jgi:hypothetical protein